jgi:shikimate kinase
MSMDRPNIVLTGFMGTGKTTVGRLLARELGYDFIDTDDLIEARAGKGIPEIFGEMGEAAFREMEAAVARELAGRQGLVVSTGGRLMLDAENEAVLGRTGRVFCLVATPEEIFERVSRDAGTPRPLLSAPDPMERIAELLGQRRDGYARFPQVATSGKTPDAVAKTVLGLFLARPDPPVPSNGSGAH